jgi:hypothetical protein
MLPCSQTTTGLDHAVPLAALRLPPPFRFHAARRDHSKTQSPSLELLPDPPGSGREGVAGHLMSAMAPYAQAAYVSS